MPSLAEVVASAVAPDRFRASPAWHHRDETVTAMKLATGAPCDGHGALFAPWPGPESGVTRWFLLASGHAVGLTGEEDGATEVLLCDTPTNRE